MAVAERLVDHLHPRLAALRDQPGGEAGFWDEIERERAPLIEPDPRTPGHSIVTYVFAAPAEARHVVVQAGYGDPRDHVMDRIPGTSVRHAAYRYRNDARTNYSFAPDMLLVAYDEASAAEIAEMMAFMRDHPPSPESACPRAFPRPLPRIRAGPRHVGPVAPERAKPILGPPAQGRGARPGRAAHVPQRAIGQRAAHLGLHATWLRAVE
jgi:hypothetical protein